MTKRTEARYSSPALDNARLAVGAAERRSAPTVTPDPQRLAAAFAERARRMPPPTPPEPPKPRTTSASSSSKRSTSSSKPPCASCGKHAATTHDAHSLAAHRTAEGWVRF